MSHAQAVFLMILVALLWSMAGVVTRHLDSAYAFEVNFWRSAFNALALTVALRWMRGPGLWRRLIRSPKEIWISGICWSIMFTAFMVAITLTTVANVLIVMALGPLITALLTRIFLHHHLPPITWLAIGVAGMGIVWMFLHEGDETLSMVGSLVSLAVPLAAATNFTLLQHVSLAKIKTRAVDTDKPVQDMLLAVLIGALLSALITLPLSLPFKASVHDLGLLSLLGVFQLAIPCLLVVRLARELSAPEISLLAQLELVFGVTWAWLWAGEHLSANTLGGGTLVLGALVANELARMFRQVKSGRKISH
ncbi:MAG: DMT family transporter [Desulfobulbaceae bacterium]|nr:DMT family transporter [Desulfobulbaceae bacterium]